MQGQAGWGARAMTSMRWPGASRQAPRKGTTRSSAQALSSCTSFRNSACARSRQRGSEVMTVTSIISRCCRMAVARETDPYHVSLDICR